MKPGAPLAVVHSSFPRHEPARSAWLSRYAEYAIASGAEREQARQARDAVAASLARLPPEQDETCLEEAGFVDPALFYAAFTWRGWVAYAGEKPFAGA